MKKLFFFAAFLIAASLTTVNAQSCSKTAGTKSACCAKTAKATATAMSNDASIEKRVCAESGSVAYFRNEKCAVSGKVTSTEVKLDEKTGTFVNVSPERAAMPVAEQGAKKACSAAEKAACQKKCTAGEKAACGVKSAKVANKAKAEALAKPIFTKGESN